MRYRNPSAASDTVSYPVLPSDFDVHTISGAYVVSATSHAYGAALHAVDLGYAKIIGEAFVGSGEKMLLITFGEPSMRRPNEEGEVYHVAVGREFFTKVLNDYSNWPTMWWREVIQNSVDAGATQMILSYKDNDDGTVTVSAQDNGAGMSEETLKSALLTLGASTKTAVSGSAGGFGVAKQLILFPWISYEIHTRNIVARGQQAAARITRDNQTLNGTRISVVMPRDNSTSLHRAADYISTCYLPAVRFSFIDGNTGENYFKPNPETGKSKAPKANLNTDNLTLVDSGENYEIYYKKQKKVGECDRSGRIYVRIVSTIHGKNCFEMFSRRIQAQGVEGDIVVDITGASTQIFVSSRTGFTHSLIGNKIELAVEKYISRLSADTKSALKSKKGHIKAKYRNRNKTTVPVRPPTHVPKMLQMDENSKNYNITQDAKEAILDQFTKIFDIISDQGGTLTGIDSKNDAVKLSESYIDALPVMGTNHLERALEHLNYAPDFILYSEIDNFTIPARFRPETMTTRVRRMLQVWTECVRWCLMQMNYAGRQFSVGFHFDTMFRASYLNEDGEDWVMLNPFGGSKRGMALLEAIHTGVVRQSEVEGELLECLWRVTDRDQFDAMYACAIHECTHFEFPYHNEPFASAMTDNVGTCASGLRQFSNIIKATKEGARSSRY